MIELREEDIQVRYISGASRKIIINSNANFYLEGEQYDFSNNSIEDKRHQQLKSQILENQKLRELVEEIYKHGVPISLKECAVGIARIQSFLDQSKGEKE